MDIKEITKIFLDKNVNEYVEKKNGLAYLSWATAFSQALKEYPTLKYEVKKDIEGNPYFGNEFKGYFVFTSIEIEGIEREMMLPVLDYKNKAMLNPTTFDINKAIMRCLTKNLAMFGLGLYIYSGEDLPEEEKKEEIEKKQEAKKFDKEKAIEWIVNKIDANPERLEKILNHYKIEGLTFATEEQLKEIAKKLK